MSSWNSVQVTFADWTSKRAENAYQDAVDGTRNYCGDSKDYIGRVAALRYNSRYWEEVAEKWLEALI